MRDTVTKIDYEKYVRDHDWDSNAVDDDLWDARWYISWGVVCVLFFLAGLAIGILL